MKTLKAIWHSAGRLALAAGAAAQAQERPLANAGLPRSVETRLTRLIEDPATRKIDGEVTLAETHEGSVVVFKGPLRLSGKINGELLVIDGNVTFENGATLIVRSFSYSLTERSPRSESSRHHLGWLRGIKPFNRNHFDFAVQ